MKAIRSKTGVRKLHKADRERYPDLELVFFLQDWEDAYNVGSMFRLADSVGARELVVTGRTPLPPDPMIGVTSLGHHRRIPVRQFAGHEEAAQALKEEGYALVAIEIAEGAVSVESFDYPRKLCLVLGNEAGGVYGSVMKHCDAAVQVPMFGKGRSMNVVVAAAVVAYRARIGS
ncbi:MAG: tRNA (guanosine(18)-2'-O)-methyltransferase [Fimbriimonadaceae bacterium]|nr:tRNA (guanosine(18)-2'-O)-methyltransferase [Fimbriimonadaceae bacterium]